MLLADLGKPTIAMINGAAAGAGLDLACACDFRFAASTAKLVCAYTRVGFSPDAGGTWFLPRMIGMSAAKELIYTGEIWMAVSAGLTAAGATWVIPNRDPKAEHQEESVQPPYVGDEPTTYDGMGAPVSNPDPLDGPNEDYEPRHIMRHDR